MGLTTIDVKLSQDLTEIKIMPIGDVHYGSNEFNEALWKDVLHKVSTTDNLYITLGGDLIDNITIDSKGDIFKQRLSPHEQMTRIIADLTPIKHKILAITNGNHESRTYNRTGFDYSLYLAETLGIVDRYSYGPYVLFVSFGKNQGREGLYYTFVIYSTHGSGGSINPGGKLNKLLKTKETLCNADVYFHHHTHEPLVTKKPVYYADTRTKDIYFKERTFVNGAAFLNFGGYGAIKGYSPASNAVPIVILTLTNDRNNPKMVNVIL